MNLIPVSAPARRLAALGLALSLAGCAAVVANRRVPGVLAGGTFTPARAASTRLGEDPSRTCPVGGEHTAGLCRALAGWGCWPGFYSRLWHCT